jgi:hypothetical protein
MCLIIDGLVFYNKHVPLKKRQHARKWFALGGPSDAPPLPLSYNEREDLKCGGSGLARMVAYYARSLEGQDYDLEVHPSFHDYACAVMASDETLEFIRDDPDLLRRFPPRLLPGLVSGLHWETPKVYAETMARERRREARQAGARVARLSAGR